MGRIKMKQVEGLGNVTVETAIEEFLKNCRLRNLSPKTIRYYEEDLQYHDEKCAEGGQGYVLGCSKEMNNSNSSRINPSTVLVCPGICNSWQLRRSRQTDRTLRKRYRKVHQNGKDASVFWTCCEADNNKVKYRPDAFAHECIWPV